jgi:HTH-type transcriptional repressor of NAD biosynthesis genes
MRCGLVLGKFLPLHQGHLYLLETASQQVDQLFVLLDPIYDDVIPAKIRLKWLKTCMPNATVILLPTGLPQTPVECPESFWPIWHRTIEAHLSSRITDVFASENYGDEISKNLARHFQHDVQFHLVDIDRLTYPVSGTQIRLAPLKNWQFISDVVKPYCHKTVCIFGPESVGKSTLTELLTKHYQTSFVPEYARTWIEERKGNIGFEDLSIIANCHHQNIQKTTGTANKVLFVDTDALTTHLWSEELFGKTDQVVLDFIPQQRFDLTLLLDVDVPWIEDVVRFRPEERDVFYERCKLALIENNRTFVCISGNWEERFQRALVAVNNLFDQPLPDALHSHQGWGLYG